RDKIELATFAEPDSASQAKIRRCVVRADESISAVTGEAVVEAVVVLIGIAGDGGVDGASAAVGDHAGELPVVEEEAEAFMSAMEDMFLGGESGDETVALVGDAGATLGVGLIRILDGGRLSGDEGVLAVVDGVSVGVGEAEVDAAGHAAIQRNRRAV